MHRVVLAGAHDSGHGDFASVAAVVGRLRAGTSVPLRLTARLGAAGDVLPFALASAVRPGMVMVDENGDFDVVATVERVELTEPVYDLDVERTHNFVAGGLVTHNSIYAFRGADIRNILEFERDFPGTSMIPLEQNYRSTNTILRASNAVIAQNRDRKEKTLWSELGEGGRCACSRPRTSTPRRASSPPRSPRSSRRATRAATSPSSTGRTRRAACSRTCSSARGSATR